MAMYYYASKLSAIACGTRCKHQHHQQQHQQHQQQQQQHHNQHHHHQHHQQQQLQQQQLAHQLQMQSEAEATTATTAGGGTNNSAMSAESVARGGGGGGAGAASGGGGGGLHRSFATRHQQQGHQRAGHRGSGKRGATTGSQLVNGGGGAAGDGVDIITMENAPTVLGSGGIMYCGGNIMSGPQDSLVDLLMPSKTEDLDKEFIFSFLLSSRLFVRPHELLGRLLGAVPTEEPLDRLVGLLGIWTNTFPYDFRDERIMCHVKHIAARCANTSLGDVVSELLSALLNRLTELEQHEKELRVSHALADETEMEEKLPSATQLAQLLCLIERKMAKHVGPEEFVQYSSVSSHLNKKVCSKKSEKSSTSTATTTTTTTTINGTTTTALTNGTPTDESPNALDPKKTCNLESYLEWSARLRTLVANEVLLCNGIRDRSKSVELWSGVAQYCLLVGNYNSATAILESLESPAIGRLQTTWSKLSSTSQQLDCMQRHADGCGDLWHKQTGSNSNHPPPNQYPGHEEKQHLQLEQQQQQQSTYDTVTDKSDVSSSIMSTTGTASATASSIGGVTVAITIVPASGAAIGKVVAAKPPPLAIPKPPSTDWVVIPVFADIVRLAVLARDDCQIKLPNGHLNVDAFNRLARIVGAFTKHMCDTLQNSSASAHSLTKPNVRDEYQKLCRRMQNCTLHSETDFMLASFDCEQPSSAEKEAFNLT